MPAGDPGAQVRTVSMKEAAARLQPARLRTRPSRTLLLVAHVQRLSASPAAWSAAQRPHHGHRLMAAPDGQPSAAEARPAHPTSGPSEGCGEGEATLAATSQVRTALATSVPVTVTSPVLPANIAGSDLQVAFGHARWTRKRAVI